MIAEQVARLFFERARPQPTRKLRQWAEEEVYLPDGPFVGERFRCSTQPWSGPLLDAMGSGVWRNVALVGPTQTGKSLLGFGLPAAYHLCELEEKTVLGIPDLAMASDKWAEDILPILTRTRYAHILPITGSGSRGSDKPTTVRLRNGATAKFLTAGGGDGGRAGFTAPVAILTEVDKYDAAGGSSDETDKATQMRERTQAYDRARVYMECTVTTPEGRIWMEYQAGTRSLIYIRCPHCEDYVHPEREHLMGWQEAESAPEAREKTRIVCPSCGVLWDDADRRAANQHPVLAHHGQTVNRDGTVTGDPPRTDTLSVRWTCVHNMLLPIGDVGAEEWQAEQIPADTKQREYAERKLSQVRWVVPKSSGAVDMTELDPADLSKTRARGLPRGHVPAGCRMLALGVDVGKHLLHWTLVALTAAEAPYVVDYGRVEVEIGSSSVESAILSALRAMRSRVAEGWSTSAAGTVTPTVCWVDEAYQTDVVRAFCAEDASKGVWFPARGMGWQQRKTGEAQTTYRAPQRKTAVVAIIGVGWHIVRLPRARGLRAAHVSADHWKTWLHERFALEPDKPGAASIYRTTSPSDHLPFLRHLTAERRVAEQKPGVGVVVRWENPTGRNNHWLDSTCLAVAAGHYGLAVATTAAAAAQPATTRTGGTSDFFEARRKRRGR